ncbi:MAG: GNAT family N-acetyltransferase [Candidatus Acidiferrales bacterium]
MKLTLRPYTPEDFEELYTVDQACYPPGIAYSKRTLRLFLRLPGAECLVAEAGDRIAGFILAEHDGERAHLITIDVLASERRRGVGTVLLRAIEQAVAARGVRQVTLETATDNQAAIAFWRKHGYRTVGVLKNYYLDRLDAYSMHKPLPAPKEA